MTELAIVSLSRGGTNTPSESLRFEPNQVNLIVGDPDTGKTRWLEMLDFVLGDGGTPEEAFGESLADKYDWIECVITIKGESLLLRREWKTRGLRSKVKVNGEAYDAAEFSTLLLSKLEVPEINYPAGNPYSERSWPVLSWRELYRHVYRREDQWHDLAPKQPERVQYACLLHFFGLLESVIPREYEDLVRNRQRLWGLIAQREHRENIAMGLLKGLGEEPAVIGSIGTEWLAAARERVDREADSLVEDRNVWLELGEDDALGARENEHVDWLEAAKVELRQIRESIERSQAASEQTRSRLSELSRYQSVVVRELEKLGRLSETGASLGDLKISHCPACDQPFEKPVQVSNTCGLCQRPVEMPWFIGSAEPRDRVNYEERQLKAEAAELDDLKKQLTKDLNAENESKRYLEKRARDLEHRLRPIRDSIEGIVGGEIRQADYQYGVLEERRRYLDAVAEVIGERDTLDQEITEVEEIIDQKEKAIDRKFDPTDFSFAENALREGMNEYLGSVGKAQTRIWGRAEVQARFHERYYRLYVDGEPWKSALGATSKFFFLIAYHYSLLKTSQAHWSRFPALSVLDFPPTLGEGDSVKDMENFIVKPWVHYLTADECKGQVIISGREFAGLSGANRIALSHRWT